MNEIWKDIEGYEGLYQVSNLGRVRSLNRITNGKFGNRSLCLRKGRILKPRKISLYTGVYLSKNGHVKNYTIHRLVAQAFIPNPQNKLEVNHIDGNKLNNKVDNLEWATRSENEQHAYRTGLNKIRNGKDNKISKRILQIDINTNKIINVFYGTGDIKRKYGYSSSPIIRCCNKQRKTAYKFIWKYDEN